jgi:ribosomal protein S18 acetylase RimI-like enzyme
MSSSQINSARLLSAEDEHGRIVAVDSARLDEALGCLLAIDGRIEPAHVKQFREYTMHHRIELNHCWARLDANGRIRQTVLAIINPGRTAMMFASRAQHRDEAPSLGGLIAHTATALGTADVRLAQSLLMHAEVNERRAFIAGGFVELAQLSYLERAVPRSGEIEPPSWPEDVTIETYRDDLIDDFLVALDQSYEQTLDCPGLRGIRETCDILEGHRGAGEFDPSLWMLMRLNDSPSGLILLNPSPANKSIELVYVGLAAAARGRGLGRALLRHALSLIADRPERTINLAVDERNEPALSMYAREGFRRSLRRVALIRALRTTQQVQ